jgi:hypothetical protein
LGITFHTDYRRFLLEASDVTFGTIEPAVVTPNAGYLDLVVMAREAWAWEDLALPRDWLPFCEDNGNYYCLTPSGEVVFHSLEIEEERWPNLATWIKEVWIEEGREEVDEE